MRKGVGDKSKRRCTPVQAFNGGGVESSVDNHIVRQEECLRFRRANLLKQDNY
jgi:hypothetical protein